ncbi:hypothetical protein JADG_001784 [Aureobasidium aubasidani]|nr:hypothetical protein JADG_001784 [Aureobasidium pullulans]
MASEDDKLTGLRSQILDNWGYTQPSKANATIVTSYLAGEYCAIILEHPKRGDQFYYRSQPHSTVEACMQELLRTTSALVGVKVTEVETGRQSRE